MAPRWSLVFGLCVAGSMQAAAAHLNRHHGHSHGEGFLGTSGRWGTLRARQSSLLENDIQKLQQSLGAFSQSLNAWLANFLNDFRQSAPGASAGGSSPTTSSTVASGTAASSLSVSTASRTASSDQAGPTSGSSSGGGQLAVYFGQTPGTTPDSLLPLCQDPDIDIINLAFLNEFFSYGGYPSINLGGACWPPDSDSPAAKVGAQGLLNCTNIGSQIHTCQQTYKKKILLSLGGAISSSIFPNATAARDFADTVCSLFGPGTALQAGLRPFGSGVILDGFDVDNEDNRQDYWVDFAQQLKSHYRAQQSKTGRKFYLSAAPQCPRPDASIPLALMRLADFVYVQFYNNPPCDLDSSGFIDSAVAWSNDLAGAAQVFIGAGAWPGAGNGYVDGSQLGPLVKQARQSITQAGNTFGGVMLWDGLVGSQNGYVGAAARALQ